MLVTSDNLYAHTITRTIGYYHNQVGSIVSGKNAIIEILKTKLKVDTDGIQILFLVISILIINNISFQY